MTGGWHKNFRGGGQNFFVGFLQRTCQLEHQRDFPPCTHETDHAFTIDIHQNFHKTHDVTSVDFAIAPKGQIFSEKLRVHTFLPPAVMREPSITPCSA